jgi:hypothetical protein
MYLWSPLCIADTLLLPEFFVARKYQFEAHLARPQAPFSLGFTVPDSDEEEVGGTTLRQGSQSNPLTIDESDSDSSASDDDHPDVTMMGDGFIVVDDDDDEEPSAVANIHLHQKLSDSVDQVAVVEEEYSENEASGGYYSSDAQDDDLNTEASIMGDSEEDYNSDLEVPDSQPVAVPPVTDCQPLSEPKQPETTGEQSEPIFPGPGFRLYSPSAVYESIQSSLPPMDLTREAHDGNAFTNSFPPPLPPRPSATQPSLFDRAELPSGNRPPWFSDEASGYPGYMGTNHGDRPSLFSPAPVPPYMPLSQEVKSSPLGSNCVNVPAYASRMQTPPAIQASDVTTSTTPPPSRRTKVSIGEIVEDQPPTPTSVNNMKRKADVLDDSEASIAELSTRSESVESSRTDQLARAPSEVDLHVAQTASIIAQRPKKQPRSIIGKLRSTATYLGVGAAGAAGMVALLTSLPDTFFV